MHRSSALSVARMLRRPVVSAGVAAGVAAGVVVALTAGASGSARPGPGAAGAGGAGRTGPSLTGVQALTWSSVPSPNRGTGNNLLDGVSCISATACTAVGYSTASSGAFRTLVESWDGTHWSVVPSPSVGTGNNILDGVSCISATVCTATGYSAAGSRALIESWDGTHWSVVPSPILGPDNHALNGVSCLSATACTATGFRGSKTLIESWDGTHWSVVPSPSVGTGGNDLYGVSCVSATACAAAGFYHIAGRNIQKTLTESWDGTSWSVVPSPNPGNPHAILQGVSCVSPTVCTAAGLSYTNSGASTTLIESWDGTSWSVVPSPNPAAESGLSGASCVSATVCTAVGLSGSGTVIESWDGTSWSVVPSPNPAAESGLEGVSCVSATACTAVGRGFIRDVSKTLIESGTASG